jgi:hypothetical protein
VEPDGGEVLHALMENPKPLRNIPAKLPAAFVHTVYRTDYRPDNMALFPDTLELFV